MKISIIMPTYNSSKTVLDAIKSVLNQSYKNLELLIVDDGSEDDTVNLVKSINDTRIKLFIQPNSGAGKARNLGIKEAEGDYVLFCDSDDYLDEKILEEFTNVENVTDYDVILFRTQKVSQNGEVLVDNKMNSFDFSDDDKKLLIESIYNKFLKFNQLFGFDGVCGKFINREFLIHNNIFFPESIVRFEDACFCKKVFENSSKMKYVDKLGYYYIQNTDSICHRYNPDAVNMFFDALKVLSDGRTDNNFYVKVLTTITECEVLYFYNREYKKSYQEYKKEFLDMISKSPYCDAISKVDKSVLPTHYKVETDLLKNKLVFPYMIMKKAYLTMKKSI